MKLSEELKTKRAKYEFFDGFVLAAVIILSAIGVLMVFSITGTSIFNNHRGDRLSYMIHSAAGVAMGLIAMAIVTLFPNKLFRGKLGGIILVGTMFIFFITPIWGHGTYESPVRRWLTIPGIITFQAVDLARIGFTLSLPWIIQQLIDKKKYYSKKIFSHYLLPLLYVGMCTGLIILQPDLGSSIVIFASGMIVFLSSGLHIKQILTLFSLAILAVIAVFVAGLDALGLEFYQLDRIQVWVDPFSHIQDNGLQSVMGFVSIALGGWTGEGLGQSTQALGFAIEPHTDLIVSILSEELGVIAVLGVMFLYFFIAFKCFTTALKARDVFSALVCVGVGAFFLTQPFVNLGGVSGIIPLSGVTLPLISFGMTSKISTFILIGIYFNVRRSILVDIEKHKVFKEKKQLENDHLEILSA